MANNGTTGHETEAINVQDLKATLQKLKTDNIDPKVDKVTGKGLSTNDYTDAEKNKLAGIEAGAQKHIAPTTAEVKSALGTGSGTTKYLREDGTWQTPEGGSATDIAYDSTNKKITKTINGTTSDVVSVSTIKTDLNLSKSDVGLGNVTNDAQVKRSEMGAVDGVATLDSAGKVPSSQLPSYVDDILEYDTKSAFPETGEGGKIYVDKSNNTTWRWSGTAYTQIKGDLTIGTTSGTAADGKVVNDHINNTSNPHGVTKEQVGLGSVVNTGDSATPVSGGTTKFTTGGAYTELAKKVDKVTGKGLSTNDYTTDEKNKLSGIASGAEVNQNAFSNIVVGDTTISADGKTDTLTIVAGSNVTITPDATNDKVTIAATDTTYSSKTAASGGTDVSLVTTGEKYTWNNKSNFSGNYNDLTNKPTIPAAANNGTLTIQKNGTNVQTFTANQSTNATANITVPTKVSELTNDSGFTSNTGTVTSVAVKMNGSTKGTVTTSGTIDLGTVITSHQDISGKQNKLTVTQVSGKSYYKLDI